MADRKGAQYRLRSHLDFAHVYRPRQSIRNRSLTLCFLKSRHGFSRLGLSVSKRMGNAVHRNRIKRILREAFRQECAGIAEPYDIVLIPRSFETGSNLEVMVASLRHLIRKLNDIAKEPSS
ncbi:MAG: ribonuclease P protein component [Planctomycetota bacterium]|jgi:ribonuclease P protein component